MTVTDWLAVLQTLSPGLLVQSGSDALASGGASDPPITPAGHASSTWVVICIASVAHRVWLVRGGRIRDPVVQARTRPLVVVCAGWASVAVWVNPSAATTRSGVSATGASGTLWQVVVLGAAWALGVVVAAVVSARRSA